MENNTPNTDTVRELYQTLSKIAESNKEFFNDGSTIRNIQKDSQSFTEDSRELENNNRLLRIGIIGQIKAGKSTLLNHLLFNGQDVLPKAATPMTAALTHIVKGARNVIETTYFDKKSWADIERLVKQTQQKQPTEPSAPSVNEVDKTVSGAREIYNHVKKNGINVQEYLGKTETQDFSNTNDLAKKLLDLVSTKGTLSPLVQQVKLEICEGAMPDFDIVDTPGFNDPVVSRDIAAQRLLGKCDVAILMSYTGQFLAQTDKDFLLRRIREKGIKHVLVVGSKFDSVMMDEIDSDEGPHNFDETYNATATKLRGVTKNLKTAEAGLNLTDDDVQFISTMASDIANNTQHLNEEQEHILRYLNEVFPDYFDGMPPLSETSRSNLLKLGNMEGINARLQSYREKKDKIIRGRLGERIQGELSLLYDLQKSMIEDVEDYWKDLDNFDPNSAENKKQEMESILIDVKDTVEIEVGEMTIGFYKDNINKVRKFITTECSDVEYAVTNSEITKYKTVEKRQFLGGLIRLLRFSSGWETQEYSVFDSNNAIMEIEKFLDEVQRLWKTNVLIPYKQNTNKHCKDLRDTVVIIINNKISNEAMSPINESELKRTLKKTMRSVVSDVGEILSDTNALIDSNDSAMSQIIGDDSDRSKTEFLKSLRGVVREMENTLLDTIEKLIEATNNACAGVTEKIQAAFNTHLDDLTKQIEQKKFMHQRCIAAVKELKNVKVPEISHEYEH